MKNRDGGDYEGKKWDVYVYGDVNIDLVVPGVSSLPKPGQEGEVPVMDTYVGGGAALFALGIGKLGLHPVFQGEVGDDCYGELIRKEFAAKNIDDSLLETSRTEKTGISISFTNEKDRSFLTYRGTNAGISIDKVDIEGVKNASHIHMTGYEGSKNHAAYLSLLKRVKAETEATVSFDLGWDPTGEWNPQIKELFPYIDVLFVNETEAIHYGRTKTAQEAAREFAKDCDRVVIRLGSSGSFAIENGKEVFLPAYRVKAVDTTGAGDSFNAGFVYGFLTGKALEECLACGNACGALNVTAYGGNTGFPDKEGLKEFMGKKKGEETK